MNEAGQPVAGPTRAGTRDGSTASGGGGGSLAASAQLARPTAPGAPFSVGAQVTSAFNPLSGSTELFVLGTGGTVFNLLSDATSDTGWSVTDLHFPGAAARIAAPARTATGH